MRPSNDGSDFWNRTARKYASDPIKDLAGYWRTVDAVRERLATTDIVLEIGCGTGMTALALAQSVARIVATDISEEMVAIARETAAAKSVSNVEFIIAPVERLPCREGGFDAVLAFNVLHLIPDRRAALKRIGKVLKPGGLFVSKTPVLTEMNPLLRVAVPLAQMLGRAPAVSFFSAAMLEREMEDAGFAIIERARHGSARKDPRIYLVGRIPA